MPDAPPLPPLRLYNTLGRTKQPFTPRVAGQVSMYTCGPTVYARAHIGNLRSYVFPDVLKRLLQAWGLRVRQLINITDVGHLTSDADEGEDKLERAARQVSRSAWEIAAEYEACFRQDLGRLNILPPEHFPRATEHIAEQIALIARLEEKSLVYRTTDGLYYDTARFPRYAALARLDLAGLQQGARVEMGEKRRKTDFALWKFTPPGVQRQMEWDSPWGRGFPGWHIECSAMAMAHLGEELDLHSGGVDHIPVHHTNEIAQSEAASGKPFVRFWLHGQFLVLGAAERMGKSEGNLLTLDDLAAQGLPPLAFRYLALNSHYRQFLHFTSAAIAGAHTALEGLQRRAQELLDTPAAREAAPPRPQEVLAGMRGVAARAFLLALCDDLNAPKALGVLWSALREGEASLAEQQALLLLAESLLGLGLLRPPAANAPPEDIPPEVQALAEERWQARQNKDFQRSDALRQTLKEAGYSVMDTAAGYTLKRL